MFDKVLDTLLLSAEMEMFGSSLEKTRKRICHGYNFLWSVHRAYVIVLRRLHDMSSLLNFRETRCYHNLFCSMNWLRLRRKNVLTLVQFKFISIKFINRLINTQFSRKSHRIFQIFSHIWPIHLGPQWFWIISFIYFCWPFIRLGCW